MSKLSRSWMVAGLVVGLWSISDVQASTISVRAGPDQTVRLPNSVLTNGTVLIDGIEVTESQVDVLWSVVSGEGVTISSPTRIDTTVSFSTPGIHILRLTAGTSAHFAFDDVIFTVLTSSVAPTNRAPHVNAGPDRTVVAGSSIALHGSVSDDGLPNPPGRLTVLWAVKNSTPMGGNVLILDEDSPTTQAVFQRPGVYVLQLSAHDGQLSGIDEAVFTVLGSTSNHTVNRAPIVDAGADQSISIDEAARLSGRVSDDGLPISSQPIVVNWAVVAASGTMSGRALIANPARLDTTVKFTEPGVYILRLTAFDGELHGSDQMTITVHGVSGSSNPANGGIKDIIKKGTKNKFNPSKGESATVTFYNTEAGFITARVFDRSGRVVRNLLSGHFNPGDVSLKWDGKDDGGQSVSAGMYHLLIERDSKFLRKLSMIVVK